MQPQQQSPGAASPSVFGSTGFGAAASGGSIGFGALASGTSMPQMAPPGPTMGGGDPSMWSMRS